MMQRMYGIEMEIPAGKLPGYYAQVVHQIGDQVQVFDRDQQLFIVSSQADRDVLIQILDKRNMRSETFDLWLLPAVADRDRLMDYGFVSISERCYAYADLVTFFGFDPQRGNYEDRWAALQQMNEYIITAIPLENEDSLFMIDREQIALIEGIAAAYQISVRWH